jgi:hypothetical protein
MDGRTEGHVAAPFVDSSDLSKTPAAGVYSRSGDSCQVLSASAPARSRRDPMPSLRYALLRCTSIVFGVT